MKRKMNKGFTLAELLIVVAIIGVLVAISIPIFTGQLEKAREATDAANIRSAYAELSADALMGEAVTKAKTEGKITINTAAKDKTEYTATVTLTQQTDDWQAADVSIGGLSVSDSSKPQKGGKANLTVKTDGTATLTYTK